MTFHVLTMKRKHRLRIVLAALIGSMLSVLVAGQAAPASAAETAKKFFDTYREQEVDVMASLFTEDATFAYVPLATPVSAMSGKRA